MQPQSESDTECATEHREHRDIDTHERQCNQDRNHERHGANHLSGKHTHARVEALRFHHAFFNDDRKRQRDEEREKQRQQRVNHRKQGDFFFAHRKTDIVECRIYFGKDAGQVQRSDAPHRKGDGTLPRFQERTHREQLTQQVQREPYQREGSHQQYGDAEDRNGDPLRVDDFSDPDEYQRQHRQYQAVNAACANSHRTGFEIAGDSFANEA